SSLAGTAGAPAPKVWVLVGRRAGDRAQLLGLAEALGWPFEVKELAYNRLHNLPNLLLGASTATLDRNHSSPLAQPWPDLVLDCGKRSVPIARWIRDQSGGRMRWVHLGRSWAPIELFDLVITTPQYRLLPRPNVLLNAAPLHRVTPERLAESAAAFERPWTDLPRPWFALLVGGDSPPYVLDPATAQRLGTVASAIAKAAGGSLLVTTSGRTRPAAVDALHGAISCPTFFHRWQPDAKDNPYLAYLALADSLIVTGDSASMLAEACAAGKPVALFDLPERPGLTGRSLAAIERLFGSHGSRTNYRGMPKQQDLLARTFDRLIERGLFMAPRDLAAYHQALIDRGLVHRVGERAPAAPRRPLDDLQEAVNRVRKLMAAERRVD
ncbi:MAG: mitochondrial fission ELM1 family protein, partial [Dongiaceae bacterium]